MQEDSNLAYGKQHHQVVFIFTNTYSNVREQTLSERSRIFSLKDDKWLTFNAERRRKNASMLC